MANITFSGFPENNPLPEEETKPSLPSFLDGDAGLGFEQLLNNISSMFGDMGVPPGMNIGMKLPNGQVIPIKGDPNALKDLEDNNIDGEVEEENSETQKAFEDLLADYEKTILDSNNLARIECIKDRNIFNEFQKDFLVKSGKIDFKEFMKRYGELYGDSKIKIWSDSSDDGFCLLNNAKYIVPIAVSEDKAIFCATYDERAESSTTWLASIYIGIYKSTNGRWSIAIPHCNSRCPWDESSSLVYMGLDEENDVYDECFYEDGSYVFEEETRKFAIRELNLALYEKHRIITQLKDIGEVIVNKFDITKDSDNFCVGVLKFFNNTKARFLKIDGGIDPEVKELPFYIKLAGKISKNELKKIADYVSNINFSTNDLVNNYEVKTEFDKVYIEIGSDFNFGNII